MLNIISHDENENLNHKEIPFHIKMAIDKKLENDKRCQKCGEIGTLIHTVGK